MYKEVNKKEAVEIYLAGGMVFAGSGQSLDRLGCFTLETVKNRCRTGNLYAVSGPGTD